MSQPTMTDHDPLEANKGSAFTLLTGYLLRDRKRLLIALIMLLVATGLDVLGPILAKHFIDDFLLPRNFDMVLLGGLLGVYVVAVLMASILRYQQKMAFTRIALNAVIDIRQRVFRHVLKLPISWFDHHPSGALVSRITNDTEAIQSLYVEFLSAVLTNTVLLLGILTAMAVLDVHLMLLALALIPTVLGVIYIYQRASGKLVAATRQQRSDINNQISESIAGIAVIQATAQQQRFANRFEASNENYYQSRVKTVRISALLLRPAINFLSALVTAGVIWIFGTGTVEASTGVEIGVLYAFLNYLGRFIEPLAEITQRFNLYQQAMVAGARVNALLQQPVPGNHDGDGRIHDGKVTFNEVEFGYLDDRPVIKKLELTVPAGGFYAIVGHTGSGKSTLLSLLLGFYQPQGGRILLDDAPLGSYSTQSLREGIALIPQEPFIIAGTIAENIAMGREIDADTLKRSAHEAGLDPLLDHLADGLDAQLGERGTRLSTGQRQQLVIARALAGRPRILLLDEATANIDSETEQLIQSTLERLHGKVTLIVIAHRLSTIRKADRIVLLADGEIVERGTHVDLVNKPEGRYRHLYELQQQAQRVELAQ